MQIFLIISLIIAIIAVVFAVQNTETATISFLAWEGNLPLALVTILSLVAGVLIGILVSTPSIIRNKWAVRNQVKKIKDLEVKIEDQAGQLANAEEKIKELESKPGEAFPTLEEGTEIAALEAEIGADKDSTKDLPA